MRNGTGGEERRGKVGRKVWRGVEEKGWEREAGKKKGGVVVGESGRGKSWKAEERYG